MTVSIRQNVAESTPSIIKASNEDQQRSSYLPTPTTDEREILESTRNYRIRSGYSSVTGNDSFLVDEMFQSGGYLDRIESTGFPPNRPWLPSNALELLSRLKRGPISEKRLVKLMKLIAERASAHFQLAEGKFVAMTFVGRIIEASDTRIGLLKKIQSQKYPEQIFVWKVGSDAFSGRL